MRNILITLFIILAFSLSTNAQNSNDFKHKKYSLKYGYGSTFHSNEMLGNHQYGEFTRFMGRRFAFSILGGYIDADNFSDNNQTDYEFNVWKGDFNLYLLPVSKQTSSLKIGGGISGWTGEFRQKDSTEVDFTVNEDQSYGWNLAAEYEVYVVNTIILGARAAFTKARNQENYYFFGLNAGIKF